jgi:hypothetical protein
LSLLKYGLDSAYGGFGVGRGGLESARSLGSTSLATGKITYKPLPSKTSSQIVDELATLLTSGRLSSDKRTILKQVYDEAFNRGAPAEALINVEQLIVLTPEFNTNGLSQNTGSVIPEDAPTQPSTTPYKAVIYIMLEGGYDSFNMLVPNICQGQNAAGKKVDVQYRSERGNIGFSDNERSLTINVDAQWNQPCTQFALHDELTVVKELYDTGDLTLFANTGAVSNNGMTKANYASLSTVQLFAHNTMQRETKTIDPKGNVLGTGVLGRLAEVLYKKGFRTNSIAIDNLSIAVVAESSAKSPPPITVSRNGPAPFAPKPSLETLNTKQYALQLNAQKTVGNVSSLFGETFSRELVGGIRLASKLESTLAASTLGPGWPTNSVLVPNLGRQFQMVSRMIQTHNGRGTGT